MLNVAFMENETATPGSARACEASGTLIAHVRFAAIEARLVEQAEAMTALRAGRSRHHRRGADSWTREDEAVFARYLADLRLASAGQVAAVLRSVVACARPQLN
jgi:hypothetical protein